MSNGAQRDKYLDEDVFIEGQTPNTRRVFYIMKGRNSADHWSMICCRKRRRPRGGREGGRIPHLSVIKVLEILIFRKRLSNLFPY